MIPIDLRLGYLSVLTVGDLFAASHAGDLDIAADGDHARRVVRAHNRNFQRVATVGTIVRAQFIKRQP